MSGEKESRTGDEASSSARGSNEPAGERSALVPKTMVLADSHEHTEREARAIEAWDHASVMFWIMNDCCWSQETELVFFPMTFVIILFTRNVWASRDNKNEFRHALAVFFWLVGANTAWVYQDFYGSIPSLEVWCLVCYATSISIEVVQLVSAAAAATSWSKDAEESGDAYEVSDAFQAIAVLSWAAHDMTVFMYYNLSTISRYYCRVTWWMLSIIILAQVSYYLIFQTRLLVTTPESSGADYALALFAWSVGCILWEFGDFYMPEEQEPGGVLKLPDDARNFRWASFWVIVLGSVPLMMWCVRHFLYFTRPRGKID